MANEWLRQSTYQHRLLGHGDTFLGWHHRIPRHPHAGPHARASELPDSGCRRWGVQLHGAGEWRLRVRRRGRTARPARARGGNGRRDGNRGSRPVRLHPARVPAAAGVSARVAGTRSRKRLREVARRYHDVHRRLRVANEQSIRAARPAKNASRARVSRTAISRRSWSPSRSVVPSRGGAGTDGNKGGPRRLSRFIRAKYSGASGWPWWAT